MSKIRSIKPEINKDEAIARLSSTAWRLWVSMWTFADDDGRLPANSSFLRAEVFWAREPEVSIDSCLGELIDAKCVSLYASSGKRFARLRNFADKHQRISSPQPPKYPGPDDADRFFLNSTDFLNDIGLIAPKSNAIVGAVPNTCLGEEGEREGKGIGEEMSVLNLTPTPSQLELVSDNRIETVFAHWLSTWRTAVKGNRSPVLSPKRRRCIAARLAEGYTTEDIAHATTAVFADPWHLERRFYDIELICRDPEHMDRFLDRAAKAGIGVKPLPVTQPVDLMAKFGIEPANLDGKTPEECQAILDNLLGSRAS